ncbi:OsmC family peroxiredoxin [Dyadobacter subterraneus]|uniref:OsmC family peroxiredoxin n=1 Tax=Dyadobacter subterraneus TaxID=2773304 RepID=UPI001D167858|nr:OsmC family peroxiredoxin [Dyadobacter subterraneus]
MTTRSNALNEMPFNFNSCFAEQASGTNPEELPAAAHACCFTMKLSFVPGEAGFVAEFLKTVAGIRFVNGNIAGSHLTVSAKIPGISRELLMKVWLMQKATVR